MKKWREQGFSNAELRDLIGLHAELPDIWDFAHGTWEACSGTSRFKPEAAQEDLIRGIKQLTPKPVVGVGRFTSPDLMVRQIKQGILDFIGAARPSIADPFLPNKIDEGRIEDIRECIGCNICVTGDMTRVPCRAARRIHPSWRNGARAGIPSGCKPKATETESAGGGSGAGGAFGGARWDCAAMRWRWPKPARNLGGRVAREMPAAGTFRLGAGAGLSRRPDRQDDQCEVYRDFEALGR